MRVCVGATESDGGAEGEAEPADVQCCTKGPETLWQHGQITGTPHLRRDEGPRHQSVKAAIYLFIDLLID